MLKFSDIDPDTYTIRAGNNVFRYFPVGKSIPDAAYSWDSITIALEAALLIYASKKCGDVKSIRNVITGLEQSCGIYLDGFITEKMFLAGKK